MAAEAARVKDGGKLIIGGGAVLLLGGAVALLALLPEKAPDEQPSESPSPSPPPLTDLSYDSFASARVTLQSGETYTVALRDGEYVLEADNLLFPANTSMLTTASYAAMRLAATSLVLENAPQAFMADCGLQPPQARVRVTAADGVYTDLLIGAQTPSGSGHYACLLASSDVYIVSNYQASQLLRTAEDYYNLSLMPVYDGYDETGETLTFATAMENVTLTRPDGSELAIYRREGGEPSDYYPLLSADYEILRPFSGPADTARLKERFLNPLCGIAPSKIADKSTDELSRYGLDNPYILRLTDREGLDLTLYIGSADSESGGRYIMREGIDCVLLDTAADYGFLTTDPTFLRVSILILYNINDVARVEYDLNGLRRVLDIDITLDADGSPEEALFRLDGKEISEDNGRRLYRRVLDLTLDGRAEGQAPPGAERYTFTFTMHGGDTHTFELTALDGRRYAAATDGEQTGFYVGINKLRRIPESFDIIDGGGTLTLQ
ncbi:MAG: DUF4340 domain-containing protein [Oscillospiraceae bacterium]|nr:DUF4340 domain-containing protein [Oscillospiraceae bacterium]